MSELRQTYVIARREFLERVRTKWFAIVTLLGPIGMIAMIAIPVLIQSHATTGSKLQIADATGILAPKLAAAIEHDLKWHVTTVPASTPDDELRHRISTEAINGYLRVPADALDGGQIDYRGDNGSSQSVVLQLAVAVNTVVQAARGSRMHLTDEQITTLLKPATFSAMHTTGETPGSSGVATFVIGYLLAFILYFVITLYCVNVMRSVVVEKSSRVMELLSATVKPRVLLGGKILGVGGASLLQISVWLVMGGIVLADRDQLLGALGATGPAPQLPELASSQVAVIVAYFLVGYFFYSSLFAAAGSLVSSEQDIQQVQLPITIILMVGTLCITVVSNDPRGGAAIVLTMVPLWSPMLMPMRYVLGGATGSEVALSLGILVVATVLMVAVAARIYRVGVLMYGKRASLVEVARWIRHG